jgi:hypothetical protein
MTLDNESDEAGAEGKVEGLFGDVDTGRIEWDASLHNTSAISECASALTKFIDASGLWYDIEESCYIEEPAPGLGSREQYGVPSTPAQAQPQTLPQSSTPLQDQINQQDIDDIAQACQWSLRLTPSPSLPTAAMMDGLMIVWLNSRKNWGWLWKSK